MIDWPAINTVHFGFLIADLFVIKQIPSRNDIDILAITETWLRPSNLDSLTIGDLTPTGYQFHHVMSLDTLVVVELGSFINAL